MSYAYIGTSYHQALYVPYLAKEEILPYGEKCKEPTLSISHSPSSSTLFLTHSQAAISLHFNHDQTLITHPLQITYSDPSVKIIGSSLLRDNQFFYFTNNGGIFSKHIQQDQKQEEESNTVFDYKTVQIPKVDSKHFYRRVITNDKGECAFIGKGVLPFVYSHPSSVVMWRGKNVANDELDLEVPIDDVDCCFLNNDSQLVVANANDMIRIFDIRSKRKKPLLDFKLKLNDNTKSRISRIQPSACEDFLIVAKENGSIYEVELKKDCQPTRKYKGITSTIVDIQVSHQNIYVISLDCFFRIFDRDEKKVIYQRYLNAHPTCLFLPEKDYNLGQEVYQVEQFNEEEEEKNKGVKKIKQIRKRNKVGLRYLEGHQDSNKEAKQEDEGEEQKEGEVVKSEMQDESESNFDE